MELKAAQEERDQEKAEALILTRELEGIERELQTRQQAVDAKEVERREAVLELQHAKKEIRLLFHENQNLKRKVDQLSTRYVTLRVVAICV